MARLTLHIGSHKTGTTSIQDTFAHNAALLAQHGLGFARGDVMPHLHQFLGFIDPVTVFPQGFRMIQTERLVRALCATHIDHVFASSENFSFFFQQDKIDDLARALSPVFSDVRILVYLRRQDRHAVSHHQEGAKPFRRAEGQLWGHSLGALPEPNALQALYLDYDQRLAMWEKAFGKQNIILRVFDRKTLKEGDVVSDVLDLLGLGDLSLERLPDSNVSLDRLRAKIGHISNSLGDDDRTTASLLRLLPASRDRLMPSRDEARAFLETYRASNRRLNARHGISDIPDLFDDDFDDYPEVSNAGWKLDEVDETLRAVIAALSSAAAEHAVSVDDLRTAAAALMHSSPKLALRLVRAALASRPDGPLLLQMRQQIEQKLKPQQHSNP
jgi:hypothetical protein